MEDQKQQLIQRLKEAKNVLVTVSKNPSVDQLSAAIGLAVALNRLDKHATAVFSGEIPNTLQFLRPEETLEKTTDSLRDFIIALDKSKADKLRYKVEDEVVRIFITPYHTAISERDLDFSQGEFNVDVVVALGVRQQQDLDEAVQAHGRILHDATVANLSLEGQSEIGALNIVDTTASSLSEMVLDLVENLGKKILDVQIATALLTGIVATTERFSNDRTTPKTMSASAALMAAGANQQLITTELEAPEPELDPVQAYDELAGVADQSGEEGYQPDQPVEPGTLEINHETAVPAHTYDPDEALPDSDPNNPQIYVDENGRLSVMGQEEDEAETEAVKEPEMVLPQAVDTEPPKIELKHEQRLVEPPQFESSLTSSAEEEGFNSATDGLTEPPTTTPILSHNQRVLGTDSEEQTSTSEPTMPVFQPPRETSVPAPETESVVTTSDSPRAKTLSEIEAEVNSPHLHASEVTMPEQTASYQTTVTDSAPEPEQSINNTQAPEYAPPVFPQPPVEPAQISEQPAIVLPQPEALEHPIGPVTPQSNGQSAPPPVPPPMMPFN